MVRNRPITLSDPFRQIGFRTVSVCVKAKCKKMDYIHAILFVSRLLCGDWMVSLGLDVTRSAYLVWTSVDPIVAARLITCMGMPMGVLAVEENMMRRLACIYVITCALYWFRAVDMWYMHILEGFFQASMAMAA